MLTTSFDFLIKIKLPLNISFLNFLKPRQPSFKAYQHTHSSVPSVSFIGKPFFIHFLVHAVVSFTVCTQSEVCKWLFFAKWISQMKKNYLDSAQEADELCATCEQKGKCCTISIFPFFKWLAQHQRFSLTS